MNTQDKKKLATIVGSLKKADDKLTELLRKEQTLLDSRNMEVNEAEDPRDVVEADIQCLSEMSEDLAKVGQTLMDHFSIE